MDIQELRRLKENSYEYFTKENSLEAVRQAGFALRYVKNQDKDICIEAVKENGIALRYVKNQDKDICLEAVRQDGHALQYVKNQDKYICLEAVRENGYAIYYVNSSIFDDMEEEMTLEEIEEELGKKIKIITKNK